METLVELYDRESLKNTLATLAFKPAKVAYIGDKNSMTPLWRKSIETLFKRHNLPTKVLFYEVNAKSSESICGVLEQLKSQKPVFNISGGGDMILYHTSIFAFINGFTTFSFDFRLRKIIPIAGDFSVLDGFSWPRIDLEDIIKMAGGTLLRHVRASEIHHDDTLFDDVLAVWDIYSKNQERWANQVYYFQQIRGEGLSVNAPMVICPENNQLARCNTEILKELEKIGVLCNVSETSNRIQFEYKNEFMRHSLADTGIWLELYTYVTAKKLDLFDDVHMSVVVDWDDNTEERPNTTNEIDIVLIKGSVPVFISCKSAEPSVSALNEINTLARRFGGSRARCALITASKPQPSIVKRAHDMQLSLISVSGLDQACFGDELSRLVSYKPL